MRSSESRYEVSERKTSWPHLTTELDIQSAISTGRLKRLAFVKPKRTRAHIRVALFGAISYATSLVAAPLIEEHPNPNPVFLPSGQLLTPLAAPGAHLRYLEVRHFPRSFAGGAMTMAVSPDKKTLLVLTSGYNRLSNWLGQLVDATFTEYLFVYDISDSVPVQKQTIRIPDSFAGIAFSPDGRKFYVGAGRHDSIYVYDARTNGSWVEDGSPIELRHKGANGLYRENTPSVTGGLSVTADGSRLVIANVYNDSISVVDLKNPSCPSEIQLRPGKINSSQAGMPGGEYPFWVAVKGNNTAYVSSIRDREIVVVDIGSGTVRERIKTKGNPNQMIFDRRQIFLYVAEDNSDSVSVIDTRSNRLVSTIPVAGIDGNAPEIVFRYHGSAPSGLALSPDDTTLYVTNGGTNSVAVVRGLPYRARTVGLIPTGYYPYAVSVSGNGGTLYVANGKSEAGPNNAYLPVIPNPCRWVLKQRNDKQYVEAIQRSSLLSFPVPDGQKLARLSGVVSENNAFTMQPSRNDRLLMAALRRRIQHVIYIIKENRTYDQILGDLDRGNGDPRLTEFGRQITPNFHKLAQEFVDLDNFFDSGDVSGDGWPWSTAARETDFARRLVPYFYSHFPPQKDLPYEFEGTNRQINVGWATVEQRQKANPLTPCDPDLLPGTADIAAPDGPEGTSTEKGYLWDDALRAGLTIRNYGCFCDTTLYDAQKVAKMRYPAKKNYRVAFATKKALLNHTDPFFRGFDNGYSDYYREWEWEREFDQFSKNGNLPNLEFVRLMHDHMGSFDTACDGLNCPELQQADNDYAVGRMIDKVAHSRYKSNTLIFIVEDDAQDGADHVDAHRSTTYVVGPYVRRRVVVSQFYTTVNLVRTIEDVLGLQHLNLYTATQHPMTGVFDLSQREWTFEAVPSLVLYNTRLPIPRRRVAEKEIPKPTQNAAYWVQKTAEFDFGKEDNLGNPEKFNRIIWKGLKGNVPYPARRDGATLGQNRHQLLRSAGLAN